MRVIHLIDYPWWNGSAYYGVTMALAMALRDHDVLLVGRAGSPPVEKAKDWGLKVQDGVDLRGKRQWKVTDGFLALMREIRDLRPHVVVSHDGDSHTLACLALASTGRRAVLVRSRGDIRPPSRHLLSRWLYGRRTDAFLLSGEFMIRRGDFDGLVEREALHVVHPSIDLSGKGSALRKGKLREELGIRSDHPLIGLVARYDLVKGHDTFLKVAWRLKDLFPEARYLAAGVEEGVKVDRLRQMSRDMGIADRFYFIGRRGSSAEIISSLDVGVIASRGSEAVCRVLLEYMAAGIPVVATSVGVIPEVVEEGVTGFLVSPNDYEDMARKLGALLRDKEMREKMGREGRRRVEAHFSLERMAEKLDTAVMKLVDTGGEPCT